MDKPFCMTDILRAGEKLFHVRACIADSARQILESLRRGESPAAEVLEDLRVYLVAENHSKLELALTLEMERLYEVSDS